MSPLEILVLYLCFRLKQLCCDYVFNNAWMANNRGKAGMAGYLPLLSHVSIHGAGTLIICMVFAPVLWWLALVDMVIHGLIDRIKAVLTNKMGWTSQNKAFWITLGIDQEAHNLTHLGYIVLIIITLGGVVL